ncbi:Histone-arginine methyltransferase CARMER-like [Homarus americanus]|uniref:Histone-arginine methyltransferase CARMER-like n=1 Tax=Homarus americanus TaxID=6706 RepID=A0A8J5N6B3_HOMAM|nr:Histone-arginine methyltransferase CARMER-like [Homarus americanus]
MAAADDYSTTSHVLQLCLALQDRLEKVEKEVQSLKGENLALKLVLEEKKTFASVVKDGEVEVDSWKVVAASATKCTLKRHSAVDLNNRFSTLSDECVEGASNTTSATPSVSVERGSSAAPVMFSLNKGSASCGVKRKHHTLSIQDKVELLKKLDSGVSVRSICDLYSIGASTVDDIKKQKGKLLQFFADSESKKQMSIRKMLNDGRCSQLDKVLIKWFKLSVSEGVELSGEMSILKVGQSYNVNLEVRIEGTTTVSINSLDLKNPYFRYTGVAPQPPPGNNSVSPSESYWATVDAQGAKQDQPLHSSEVSERDFTTILQQVLQPSDPIYMWRLRRNCIRLAKREYETDPRQLLAADVPTRFKE